MKRYFLIIFVFKERIFFYFFFLSEAKKYCKPDKTSKSS